MQGWACTLGVRKDAALRLLESVEVMDQDAVDKAWTSDTMFRVDDIRTGRIRAIPGEQVFAELAEPRAARNA